ncbi:hypothetical protein SDC9_105828 [bioreactor metagenome]|uniref:Uncharacterized protein n=1 Tax=bioreactor metagenome TaxID=1076179 RepID=A0A645B352_9ZZZZ
MHDLVVADRQDEVLRVLVDHRERHVVVVVLPVDRLVLQVAERVVHPAHVPLEAEAQSALVDRLGDPREGGRLLGDHHAARLALVEVAVDVAQEVDGLEVLVAAVLVGDPLPVLTGVVQVEHRGDRVDAQAVDVELAQPVEGVGDQEALHLVAAEVEDVGAPVRVLAQARIGVLVQGGAVEPAQCPLVLGEVARHPVHDHADAGLVQPVDQEAQIVGRAELRHRGEVAGDLVAPRPGERVLGDRHELDVGVALPLDVLDQILGELLVRLAGLPRPQMHLVDAHRRAPQLGLRAVLHPTLVVPRVVVDRDDGGGVRRAFGLAGHRVGLLVPLAVGAEDAELVQRALAGPLDEGPPAPGAGDHLHRVGTRLPVVPVTDDVHFLRVRCPDGEPRAAQGAPLVVLDGAQVGSQATPHLRVAALVEPLEIPPGQPSKVIVHDLLLLTVR